MENKPMKEVLITLRGKTQDVKKILANAVEVADTLGLEVNRIETWDVFPEVSPLGSAQTAAL